MRLPAEGIGRLLLMLAAGAPGAALAAAVDADSVVDRSAHALLGALVGVVLFAQLWTALRERGG